MGGPPCSENCMVLLLHSKEQNRDAQAKAKCRKVDAMKLLLHVQPGNVLLEVRYAIRPRLEPLRGICVI